MAAPWKTGPYRGRIAPSPTGLLHPGHARTFWIAYRRALAANGTLVLRNEDLDPQRSRLQFAQAMVEDLQWLGIRWQEGPDVDGPFGPYMQSQRFSFYRAAWERLRVGGWIYPCTCSRREVAAGRVGQHQSLAMKAGVEGVSRAHILPEVGLDEGIDAGVDDEPGYPGTCRPVVGSIAAATDPAGVNWRFRVPAGEAVHFLDGAFGPCSYIAGQDFGDFLVWRREGTAAYQLAVVVDDAAMRITEVVRGADLLRSTARQILLNRALGYPSPAWFHCQLLRDRLGRKLAKRADAVSLRALRASGLTTAQVLQIPGFS